MPRLQKNGAVGKSSCNRGKLFPEKDRLVQQDLRRTMQDAGKLEDGGGSGPGKVLGPLFVGTYHPQ